MTITKFAVPCLLLLAAMAGPASAAETLPDAIAAPGALPMALPATALLSPSSQFGPA